MQDCPLLSRFIRVQLLATLWTVARQASLCIGFSRQEYWSGLPCPPPGNLPSPGIKLAPLVSPELAGRIFTTSSTWEALQDCLLLFYLSAPLASSFPDGSEVCLPPMWETWVWFLGREEEPGRWQSTGSQRVGHDWVTSLSFTFTLALQMNLLLYIKKDSW